VPKPPRKTRFFFEVSALFEVLFEVLFFGGIFFPSRKEHRHHIAIAATAFPPPLPLHCRHLRRRAAATTAAALSPLLPPPPPPPPPLPRYRRCCRRRRRHRRRAIAVVAAATAAALSPLLPPPPPPQPPQPPIIMEGEVAARAVLGNRDAYFCPENYFSGSYRIEGRLCLMRIWQSSRRKKGGGTTRLQGVIVLLT
jgi:hypothetical protein